MPDAWLALAPNRGPRQSAVLIFSGQSQTLATHGIGGGDVDAVHIMRADDPLIYHEGRFARLVVPDMT